MKTLLYRLFIANWPRKLISLALSIIIWLMVSRSMTVNKVIPNIPVRVTNLTPGKTIEGMQINGLLSKKVTLSIVGHKAVLDEIGAKDLEIIIDAKNKTQDWIASIDKRNLISLNPGVDIAKQISKVEPFEMIIRPSKLITERVQVSVSQPSGEVPKGYQFLDVYPKQLTTTITGPEETVKRIKTRGLKLLLNFNDISADDLDNLQNGSSSDSDEVSFLVPDSWKKISLPILSDTPIEIDDPQTKFLRIDFSRQNLLPIDFSIPVTVFYPPKYSKTLNPETYTLATNDIIVKKNGIKVFSAPIFAQGVSRKFLETVKDMIQMVIIASPKSERETLLWNTQFMYPKELEDLYVSKVISESDDIIYDLQPHLLEDYLRNRFRNYMNRFRLYTPDKHKLSLRIELEASAISVKSQSYP